MIPFYEKKMFHIIEQNVMFYKFSVVNDLVSSTFLRRISFIKTRSNKHKKIKRVFGCVLYFDLFLLLRVFAARDFIHSLISVLEYLSITSIS